MPARPFITHRGKIIPLSEKESKLLDLALEHGDIEKAASEVKITISTAKKYFKKPHIKAWLDRRFKLAAQHADFSVDEFFTILIGAIRGTTPFTAGQKGASDIFAKSKGYYSDGATIQAENIQFLTPSEARAEVGAARESDRLPQRAEDGKVLESHSRPEVREK